MGKNGICNKNVGKLCLNCNKKGKLISCLVYGKMYRNYSMSFLK